jgi:hypothetical protein
MGMCGQCHAPAALPLGKAWYLLCRRLGGSQGQSEQVWKISCPPGFDPWTIQPIAKYRHLLFQSFDLQCVGRGHICGLFIKVCVCHNITALL